MVNAKPFNLVFLLGHRSEFLDILVGIPNVVVITDLPADSLPNATVLSSSNPRLDFARVLSQFFNEEQVAATHASAIIHPTVKLGRDVSIGANSILESGVVIGDFSVIGPNVVVRRGTKIGYRSRVKANSVIGEDGFGFEYDETGIPIRIPHLGGVRIGNDVEIGALTVIARGTLDDTVVEDYAKIDDHVFVAHNVKIGESSVVIAGAEISGGVVLGTRVWVGPQATIREQLRVGDDALIGIGSVVVSDIPENVVVAGNPARIMRKRDENRE